MPVPFPTQSVQGWKVSLTILDIIAVLGTFFRVGLRYRQSKLWWDDAVAIIPTASLIAVLYYMYASRMLDNVGMFFLDPVIAAQFRFQNHWSSSFLGLTCVWGSRISLSIGLIRIFPSWSSSQTVSVALTSFFFAIYLLLVILYPASCKNSAGGTKMDFFGSCILLPNGAPLSVTMSIILNYIGDFLLVVCPLYMLWGLRLPTGEHRLILILFSSSLATFLVVIAMTIVNNGPWIQSPDSLMASYGVSHLESTVALMVCNLMVIAGYSYRVYRTNKSRTLVYLGASGETRRHGVSKSIAVEVSGHNCGEEKSRVGIPLSHLGMPDTHSARDDKEDRKRLGDSVA